MPSMPTAMSSSILKPVILILPVESGTTPIVFLPASMVCVSASALSMAVVHKADDPVMLCRSVCARDCPECLGERFVARSVADDERPFRIVFSGRSVDRYFIVCSVFDSYEGGKCIVVLRLSVVL